MIRVFSITTILVFSAWNYACADTDEWRTSAPPAAMSTTDKQRIGQVICGEGGFQSTDQGVACRSCPDFTGDPGSDAGLDIGYVLRGRFTGAGSEDEWILDTEGCEAHFASFGGAILLQPSTSVSATDPRAAASDSKLPTGPGVGSLTMSYYRPGFRLNDCLVFGSKDERNLLVCNEADMAQGEVIGHISAMEISGRGIDRWRLLRWYDNSAASTSEVVSVVPVSMQYIRLHGAQQILHVKLKIVQTSREAFEQASEQPETSVTLVYERKSQRLFASPETQRTLGEINLLTGKMLD